MEKHETVSSFFTKISQVRDQLVSIEVVVEEDYLLQTAIDGLPSSWETFLVVVNVRKIQPNFKRLWHDYLQEERRIQSNSVYTKE